MGSLKWMREKKETLNTCEDRISKVLPEGLQTECIAESWAETQKFWLEMCADLIGMIKRWGNSTLIHTALCRQDAGESCGSWPWRRARRTSCHWGNTYPAPTADRPRGCPASSSEGSQSRRDVCPATPAGNTWSRCSPVNDKNRNPPVKTPARVEQKLKRVLQLSFISAFSLPHLQNLLKEICI